MMQRLTINTILHTRDGRKIGNAIIIGDDGFFYLVKTDYGTSVKLTVADIEELFYFPFDSLTEEELAEIRSMIGVHKHAVRMN